MDNKDKRLTVVDKNGYKMSLVVCDNGSLRHLSNLGNGKLRRSDLLSWSKELAKLTKDEIISKIDVVEILSKFTSDNLAIYNHCLSRLDD